MNLVTLDFETYFDSEYSLTKLTTEEYVRDPRFKVHCAVSKLAGSEKGNRVWDGDVDNLVFLPDFSDNSILCHHAHFDGLILNHWYSIRPAFWFDTLSMARLVFPHAKSHSLGALADMLGIGKKDVPYESFKGVRDLSQDLYERVAQGCINDVELTYAIFQKLLPLVPQDELILIDATIRMFTEPALELDKDRLGRYLADTKAKKEAALASLGVTKDLLQSADKFAALLRQCGVEPPTKDSPKSPDKKIYAFAKTDKAFQELQDAEIYGERCAALVAARLGSKSTIGETRAERLLAMAGRGPLCIYLKYGGAGNTMRWSGGDLVNFQNFTRGSELRLSLMAPKGYQLVVIDSSQVECRLVNWHAGQWDVLDKFRNKEDIYSQLATQFYGYLVDKSKPAERGTGKQIELSCGFRAGTDSIQETARRGTYGPPVHMTKEQAKAARDLYRQTHSRVVELWAHGDNVILPALLDGQQDFMWGCLRVYGPRIYMPTGVWIDYTNLRYGLLPNKWGGESMQFYRETREGNKSIHGGIVVQNVVELMSRSILANAMLKVRQFYKIVMCTHDELVFLARDDQVETALQFGLAVMKKEPEWCKGIPLDAEGGHARNYSK